MGNLHQVIVDHVGQVVGWHAVGLEQNFIVELVGIERHAPANQVFFNDVAVFGHFKADHIRFAALQPGCNFFRRKSQRVF